MSVMSGIDVFRPYLTKKAAQSVAPIFELCSDSYKGSVEKFGLELL